MNKLEQHSSEAIEQIVKEADLGGREPDGNIGVLLALIAGLWSIFQVWYASPLPFTFGIGIFNDTEARAIHLAFAVFFIPRIGAMPYIAIPTRAIPIPASESVSISRIAADELAV